MKLIFLSNVNLKLLIVHSSLNSDYSVTFCPASYFVYPLKLYKYVYQPHAY